VIIFLIALIVQFIILIVHRYICNTHSDNVLLTCFSLGII